MDNIYFTKEEQHILKTLAKYQSMPESNYEHKYLSNLIAMGFVSYNYLPQQSKSGADIPDGTVSLTDQYKRYRSFKRKSFIEHKVPIIVSCIALLKSFEFEIISLMQWLMQLLK